jgi:NAD(P)-dependent dehydrogenase (short-subunit alcohol dehydrogenase family)
MGMLDGKTAFITGAASGIGESTAHRFAQEGARIALADVTKEDGERVRRAIERAGGEAIYLHCNVSDPQSVQHAFNAVMERWGRLDIVFANAGIAGVWAPIEDLQPEEWNRTMQTNLNGVFLTLHFALPHLKASGGGSVIITSSISGNRTFAQPGAAAYSTSKAAQVAFMKMAALELGRYDIRVNAVCPGTIPTNIGENLKARNTEEVDMPEISEGEGNPALHGGIGKPLDVADTCLFLASDLSRHVSGVEIYVDGGASLLR